VHLDLSKQEKQLGEQFMHLVFSNLHKFEFKREIYPIYKEQTIQLFESEFQQDVQFILHGLHYSFSK